MDVCVRALECNIQHTVCKMVCFNKGDAQIINQC